MKPMGIIISSFAIFRCPLFHFSALLTGRLYTRTGMCKGREKGDSIEMTSFFSTMCTIYIGVCKRVLQFVFLIFYFLLNLLPLPFCLAMAAPFFSSLFLFFSNFVLLHCISHIFAFIYCLAGSASRLFRVFNIYH